jgi:hypothetical protein
MDILCDQSSDATRPLTAIAFNALHCFTVSAAAEHNTEPNSAERHGRCWDPLTPDA